MKTSGLISGSPLPLLLNTGAVLKCPHMGTVVLIPKQFQVLAQGLPVLRAIDVIGAPIVGCLQPPTPATVPCTLVVSVLPGSTSLTVSVLGVPALTQTLTAVTNGVPPGLVTVMLPGQAVAQG